nr:uncharacterized protein LOC119177398 [Rhipicephalus microplus]
MDGSESAGARASTSTRLDKICTFCDKAFSTASNLKRHIKNVHREEALATAKTKECGEGRTIACDLCPKFFLKLLDLRQHHVHEHGFKEEVQNFTFDSYKGLQSWRLVDCCNQRHQLLQLDPGCCVVKDRTWQSGSAFPFSHGISRILYV